MSQPYTQSPIHVWVGIVAGTFIGSELFSVPTVLTLSRAFGDYPYLFV